MRLLVKTTVLTLGNEITPVMKYIITVFTLVCFTTLGNSQAGLHLYGGLSGMSNESEVLLDGPVFGYHIGGDLRLNEGGMYFLLGTKYTDVPYTTNESLYTGDINPRMQMINGRIGVGFTIMRFSSNLELRGKFLGSIDYLFNTPIPLSNEVEEFKQYRNINSTASLTGGIGVTIGPVLVDLEYGYGLFNIISKVKETLPTHLALSAGIFF